MDKTNGTHLSPGEERVLEIIVAAGKPVTTEYLARRYYGRSGLPENGRIVVTAITRSLAKKMGSARHSPRVRRSRRSGPHSIEVWVE